MSVNPEVEKQLFQIHHQRNKRVWIFHAILAISSTFFQREKLLQTDYWVLPLVLIASGLVLRTIFFRPFLYDGWKQKKKRSIYFNDMALIVLATGWGMHFGSVAFAYGIDSVNASSTLIYIAGLVTGSTISFAAHKRSFYVYSSILCLIPALIYMSSPFSNSAVVIAIVVYYFFNLSNLFGGNFQLVRSVENEISAKRNEEKIKEFMNTVPGFVTLIDSQNVYTEANDAALNTFPGLIGNKVGFTFPGSSYTKFVNDFISSNKTRDAGEITSLVKGEPNTMLVCLQKTEAGGAVSVSLPINELKKAREHLKEQEGKAHYAAKLASLGEMAAGIAHEINNPLTIIQGSASVMQKLIDQDPMDKETIKLLAGKLMKTSDRISKTIKSLKNLSRSGENDPMADVDFEKMLEQCLDISRQRCDQHGIKLKLPEFSQPIIFKGREVQLSQVVMNLLSNAIDAVKNAADPWIEVKYLKSSTTLDILISDSGPGVPQEIRKKIMEPFFTTKEVNQGTGLGLSISKSIMDAHKGELSLMEGMPTTFRMRLPLLP